MMNAENHKMRGRGERRRSGSLKAALCILLTFALTLTALSACSADRSEKDAMDGTPEPTEAVKKDIPDEGVIDTENMKIELIGIHCAINTLSMQFKVTAKQMKSLLIENAAAEHMKHYMFGVDAFTVDLGGGGTGAVKYTYSDEDPSLEPNQFYYDWLMINTEPVPSGDYYFRFSDFGSYPKEKSGKIEVLYDDTWDVPVKIFNAADTGRDLEPNTAHFFGGEKFLLSRAMITPYAIVLNFSGVSENARGKNLSLKDVSVRLRDGKTLSPTVDIEDKKDFEASVFGNVFPGRGWEGSYAVKFSEIADPYEIMGITIGGSYIDLVAEK